MTTPVGSDVLTCAQLAAAMQSLTMQELGAALADMEKRYPRLRGRMVMAMGGYGTEASPLGLGTRSEWTELLRNSKCFFLHFTSSAVAAQFSAAQLWNPVGSGKILLPLSVVGEGAAAEEILWFGDNVAQTTDQAAGANLLLGGPAGLGRIRTGSNAAIGTGGQTIRRVANGTQTADITAPANGFIAECPEGRGISVWGGTINTALLASFMWAEVDATYPR